MRMPISSESRAALDLLKEVQVKVRASENLSDNVQVSADLTTLIAVLESPVFQSILNIQDSLRELKRQVQLHPSILPADFDITPSGALILNLPPTSPSRGRDEEQEEKSSQNELLRNSEDFEKQMSEAAQGRKIKTISLYKPEGSSLGFSVVGLRSEHKGELGIYVQQIQPSGLAGKAGGLIEGDQILAIDGQALDRNMSHQKAISILQRANGHVSLIVARAEEETSFSDWYHVQVIELTNNGSGLGFGIVGGQTYGVVVKTILPNGVADTDGHLFAGDTILQINEHWLQGLVSEEVAAVLRASGNHVRLVVARPTELSSAPFSVPASKLHSQREIEKFLQSSNSLPFLESPNISNDETDAALSPLLPEMESYEVILVKDSMGLGVTIAGYTCEREELSGIFVKSVTEGSAAHRSGRVAVNDQIVEVDGKSLSGYSNQQAVEMLRSTGKTVSLKLIRYVHGLKFEQLQMAIANSTTSACHGSNGSINMMTTTMISTTNNSLSSNTSNHTTPFSTPVSVPVQNGSVVVCGNSSVLISNTEKTPKSKSSLSSLQNDFMVSSLHKQDKRAEDLNEEEEKALINKWHSVLGSNLQIVVAQMSKFKASGGLGISLEGTVEKVDGEEQNPHHYIRNVLPEGPVGQNGKLKSGDELLEVNGQQLLGLYHTDVVSILKELPVVVRIVVARSLPSFSEDDKSQEGVKDKADYGSLSPSVSSASSTSASSSASSSHQIQERFSSESQSQLALWSSDILWIELLKGDRGLGFSILDYQDPLNKNATLIVIRSLVNGGVAQNDGRLIPGDRLMYVNATDVSHASLDDAVQALKGVEKGIVKIGVSKPLMTSEEEAPKSPPPPLPNSPPPSSPKNPAYNTERPDESQNKSSSEIHSSDVSEEPYLYFQGDSHISFPSSSESQSHYVSVETTYRNTENENYVIQNTEEKSSLEKETILSTLFLKENGIASSSTLDSINNGLMMTSLSAPLLTPRLSEIAEKTIHICNHGSSEDLPLPSPPPLPPSYTSDEEEESSPITRPCKAKYWGPERTVKVIRAPNKGLGISIVGGKGDDLETEESHHDMNTATNNTNKASSTISGIFIKNVLEDSPAGTTGLLHTGDRILEVDGNNLRTASHERAVEIIRQSGNVVSFLVQSLLVVENDNSTEEEEDDDADENVSFEEENDKTVTLSSGMTIDKGSAGYLCNVLTTEVEDEYGYTPSKIQAKYGKYGPIIYIRLNKGSEGLGISLAGHKDRSKMSVFVCGLIPHGNAARDGRMKVGDQILEVNGKILDHRCHLNASLLIKNLPDSAVTFIVRRSLGNECAVKPLTYSSFSSTTESSSKKEIVSRYRQYKGVRQICIHKGDSGLGIMIIEGKHAEVGTGVFVSDLQTDSVSDKAGLLVGDMLLAVNGEDFVGMSYEAAARVLKGLDGLIHLIVTNPNLVSLIEEKPKLPPKPLSSSSLSPKYGKKSGGEKPLSVEILPGADTTIEILKDKDEDGRPLGLGLSIVGGSDTLLGSIFIHEVYEKGAAHKDGRLRPGDQILEVMHEDLRHVTHSHALHALRQTPNKVRLVIHREDDDIYETLEVELLKKKDRGLGLSIVGKKSGPGVYISEVVKGGAADSDGRLVQGDQIISVNGNDLTNSSQEEAAPVLKMAQGRIGIKVRRLRVGNRSRHTPQLSGDSDALVINGTPYTIQLIRGELGLGFSIVGGFGSPHGDMPIYVKNVFETGAASEHGGLKRGDQILSVNNTSLEGLTHQDAVNILKNSEGTVTLQILS